MAEREDGEEATNGPGLARIVALVFLPFAGGYYLSYLYRSTNAIIAPDLVADIGLSAGELGLLTAAYPLAFGLFQAPLGLLLDRFGPRRVQTVLMGLAALGAILFGLGQDMTSLTLARALIGVGVSGGLMAGFKAVTMWFPERHWPFANGCYLTAGGLGALSTTLPLQFALGFADWRQVYLALGAFNFAVAGLIWWLVPERAAGGEGTSLAEQLAGLARVYRDSLFWRFAPLCIAAFGASFAFQGLWAGPWLSDVIGLSRDGVAAHLMVTTGLLALGSILIGFVAGRLLARGIGIATTVAWGTAIYAAAQLPLVFDLRWAMLVPVMLVGFLSNVGSLCYARLSQHFGPALAGRSNAGFNVLVFLGAFVVQYLVGAVLDLWGPGPDGRYPAVAFQAGFGLVLGLQVVAWIWFLAWRRGGRDPF